MNADAEVSRLVDLLAGRRIAVLAGAGVSTESGIPDYRGPETARRARTPIQGRQFRRNPHMRVRYWARSMVGWRRFAGAEPNVAHRALAALEADGRAPGLITQNVDRLHQAAGSRHVIELHGALEDVGCLHCGAWESRHALQRRLEALNPGHVERVAELAPDGDAELPAEAIEGFQVATCLACSGVLKPRVVFFGENVARPVVDAAWRVLDASDVLLVVGSSLAVFSGYRFPREAARRGMPIAIINMGTTRADDLADVRVEAQLGHVLPRVVESLRARDQVPASTAPAEP